MGQLGTGIKFEGATTPTSIEVDSYEGAIFAKRFTEKPSNLKMEIEYGTSGNNNKKAKYIGYAPRGTATSADGWLLHFLEYNSSKQVIRRTIAFDSWDNRAAASYG